MSLLQADGYKLSQPYNCGKEYNQMERLVKSNVCADNKKAQSMILTMAGNDCKEIGTDGEYELEVVLVKKLENCNKK
jgi:hypothetical protein